MAKRAAIYTETDSSQSAAESPESLASRVRSLRLPDEVRRRRSKAPWILSLVGLVACGAVYLYWPQIAATAARLAPQPAASADAPSSGPNPASSATTPAAAAPVAANGDIVLESKGYVIPAHQILVSPKVSGMVLRLNIEEGRRVTKGEVLAELESVEYAADVARAKAVLAGSRQRLEELERGNRPEEVAGVKAELAEAEAQRDQLYLTWKRNIGLRGTRVLSESDFEVSESQYKAMDQRVIRLTQSMKLMVEGPRVERIEAARADVAQAEAELTKAEWRLSNCRILAPVSGTILKKNAEEGNIVNPIAFNGSFSVCEMADLSDLEVELSIQERDVARVHQGQKCQVRAEAYPDRVYDAVVSRLMPIADRAKGAVPVRVKLTVPPEEEGVYLKPEMGAVVSFFKQDRG